MLYFFFLMIRRPPRSTLFPTRRSSDLNRRREEPDVEWKAAAFTRCRMTRECQVRICERLGVKFPGPTRRVSRASPVQTAMRKDRKSTRLNSRHTEKAYTVFHLKKQLSK